LTDAPWRVLEPVLLACRTLGWLNGSRRLAKDYEITTASAEAMVQIAMIALLARRLAQI